METIMIGKKIVPISGRDKDGNPIIDTECEEIHHPDGRIDVIVKVPFLEMKTKEEI